MPVFIDLSEKGLYSTKQIMSKVTISRQSVSFYANLLNVATIKGVRYFTQDEIDKMLLLYGSRKAKDITGEQVHYFTAIKCTGKENRDYIWKWRCVCGNEIEASKRKLIGNNIHSCGCRNKPLKQEQIKNARKKITVYGNTVINKLNNTSKGRLNSNNKTGVNGVKITYIRGKKRFCAFIGLNKKYIHVGYFDTLEDAKQARLLAESKYHDPIVNEYESLSEIRKKIAKEII